MKFNPIAIVVVVLLICGGVYYFHHHKINMNVDVKGDNGSKSHMGVKVDGSKAKRDYDNA